MLILLTLMACGGADDDTVVPVKDTGTIPRMKPEIVTQGDPDWEISLIEMFHAPLGIEVETCLLSGNHQSSAGNWLPGTPHEGPYGQELIDALERCGYALVEDSNHTAAEWSDPNGLWMGVVLTPKSGGVQGSTPDYDLGDVIQDNRFPLVFDGDLRRDEVIVDREHDGSIPPVYDLGFFDNGHSHVMLLMGSNLSRMPAGASAPGAYAWHLSLRDATSANQGDQGYDLVLPFDVVE